MLSQQVAQLPHHVKFMPEERRESMRVSYGDKLIPLGERLDLLEKRINVQTIILGVLVLDHIGTLPQVWSIIAKLFGM